MIKRAENGEVIYSNAVWDLLGRFLTTFVGVFVLEALVGTFLVYAAIWVQFETNSIWVSIFAATMFTLFLAAILITFRSNVVAAVEVRLTKDGLSGKSIFGIARSIGFEDISEFHEGWTYSDGHRRPRIEIGKVDGMGELFEAILKNATSCRKVDLDEEDTIGNERIWQKEPDWAIINTAKRRAEENLKNWDAGSTN